MRISHLSIRNFRNLKEINIPLARGTVVVGENRSGKSNLIHAVRLVLDPTLTPRERELERGDFSDALNPGIEAWDPMREGHVIEVSVDLTELEDDPAILAALGDALIEGDPMRARLTYRFAPEEAAAEQAGTKYAWTIVGGEIGRASCREGVYGGC